MITKQAIQTQANVVRITSVVPGDVYKRFDDSYDDRTYYGLVTAVHNDGEKTIIEATEYSVKYSSQDISLKIINGTKDYTIFPSSPEELNLELEKARKDQLRDIADAEEKIDKAKKMLKDVDALISGERQKTLKAMSYKEMTQDEYAKKMLEV